MYLCLVGLVIVKLVWDGSWTNDGHCLMILSGTLKSDTLIVWRRVQEYLLRVLQ